MRGEKGGATAILASRAPASPTSLLHLFFCGEGADARDTKNTVCLALRANCCFCLSARIGPTHRSINFTIRHRSVSSPSGHVGTV